MMDRKRKNMIRMAQITEMPHATGDDELDDAIENIIDEISC